MLHLLIGVAPVRLYNRVHKPEGLDIGVVVKVEHGTITEFLLVRPQRANKVAEMFRKHRNSTVDKINACSTLLGLTVYDVAFLDIMAHVGDMHANLP